MHTYVLKHFKRVRITNAGNHGEGFSKLELLVIKTIKYPPNTSLFFMESGHACMHAWG
jgi:hypothetical protein